MRELDLSLLRIPFMGAGLEHGRLGLVSMYCSVSGEEVGVGVLWTSEGDTEV